MIVIQQGAYMYTLYIMYMYIHMYYANMHLLCDVNTLLCDVNTLVHWSCVTDSETGVASQLDQFHY